tara:strand:+ start:144 stop:275 length:132 start_codon:yes stop_codon:yes gene_type:complete
MENLQAMIDTMLQRGEFGEIEGEVAERSGDTATVVVRGTPLED